MTDHIHFLSSSMNANASRVIPALSSITREKGRVYGKGEIVDFKYLVRGVLGEGGMGTVYSAYHLYLRKPVALKTYHSVAAGEDVFCRFSREARSLAKLNHPNVVQIYDFGCTENCLPYFTMELLQGESLAARIARQRRLRVYEALEIFAQVAEALIASHSKGIVHRDIKPSNIFLETEDAYSSITAVKNVKLLDFGIVSLRAGDEDGEVITGAHEILGSPLYMSPEQAGGRSVDNRSDIYSFGCSFYHALVGVPPFVGPNAMATIYMHNNSPIPRLLGEDVGVNNLSGLQQILNKLLAKDPQGRFSSFEELHMALSLELARLSSSSSEWRMPSSFPAAGRAVSARILSSSESIQASASHGRESGLSLAVAFWLACLFILLFLIFLIALNLDLRLLK
ncbi:MAG: serine/threonine protein kinase [Candidatus Melainabacteria bacterium]|nr:serine/threonine protein kinase [Candidatus Melainabacteria bacterium]